MVDSVLATRTTSSVHIVISYSKSNSEYGLAEVDNLSEKWQTRLNAARLWQIPRQRGSHKSKIFAFLKMRYCSTWSIRTGKDLWQIPRQKVIFAFLLSYINMIHCIVFHELFQITFGLAHNHAQDWVVNILREQAQLLGTIFTLTARRHNLGVFKSLLPSLTKIRILYLDNKSALVLIWKKLVFTVRCLFQPLVGGFGLRTWSVISIINCSSCLMFLWDTNSASPLEYFGKTILTIHSHC